MGKDFETGLYTISDGVVRKFVDGKDIDIQIYDKYELGIKLPKGFRFFSDDHIVNQL